MFKEANLEAALAKYTASVALDPCSAAVWANRALVRLKMDDPAGAEEDCNRALSLDISHVKALHRRGLARLALGRAPEAAVDLDQVARKMPGDPRIGGDLQAAKEAMRAGETRPLADASGDVSNRRGGVPSPAPAEMEHIGVKDTGNVESTDMVGHATSGAPKKDDAPAKPAGTPSKQGAKAKQADTPSPVVAAALSRLSSPGAPGKPRSAVEFERALKTLLGGDMDALGAYVEEYLSAGSVAGLFKHSLSPACIHGVAVAVRDSLVPQGKAMEGARIMDELRGVPRFAMTLMLLSKAQRSAVKEAVEALAGAGADVGALRRDYGA